MTELLGVILVVGLLAIIISTVLKGVLRVVSFVILGLIAASALGIDLTALTSNDLWSTLRNKVAQLEQTGSSIFGGGGQPPAQSDSFNSRSSRSPNSQPYNSQQYNSQPYNSQQSNSQPYNSQQSNSQPYNSQQSNSQPYSSRPYNSQPYNTQQNSQSSGFTSNSSQAPALPNSRTSPSSSAANNPGIGQSTGQSAPNSSFPRPRRATPASERRPVAAWW